MFVVIVLLILLVRFIALLFVSWFFVPLLYMKYVESQFSFTMVNIIICAPYLLGKKPTQIDNCFILIINLSALTDSNFVKPMILHQPLCLKIQPISDTELYIGNTFSFNTSNMYRFLTISNTILKIMWHLYWHE